MNCDLQTTPRHLALKCTVILLNSIFWALFCAVILRRPHYGLVWALSPMLCTAGSLTNPERRERVVSLMLNLSHVAVFQWFLASLTPYVLLRVVAVVVVLFLTSLRKNSANSTVVIAGIISGWNQELFLSGVDNMCSLLMIVALIVPTYWLLDLMMLGNWRGLPGAPRLKLPQLLRRAAAFSLAIVIYNSVNLSFGSWIPLTLALIYNGGVVGTDAKRVALKRFALAPVGIMLGLLYLMTFSYLDVFFSFAAIFWGALGFFFSFCCKNFSYFYIPFLIMLCCANNLVYAENPSFGNSWNFFFQVNACVAIGAFLVYLFEHDPPETCR